MAQQIAQGEPYGFAAYFAATAGAAPRPTLLRALDALAAEGRVVETLLAVDLGCGTGRDTLPILRAGLGVTAIDRERRALDELRARAMAEGRADGLVTRCADFTAIRLPRCDLLNASFALPLCPPDRFGRVWTRLRTALLPGARLACQLYGPEDGWAGRAGITIHSRGEALSLLTGLEVERLDEELSDSVTPRGKAKRWHIWHVVARRPLSSC
jgi:tellurite methyltransferase